MLEAEAQLSEPSARLLSQRGTEFVNGGISFSHDPRLRYLALTLCVWMLRSMAVHSAVI
jgi:hypothetical protein